MHRLQTLLAANLRVRPAVLQVEHHPYNANRELLAFCQTLSPPLRVTAYASLGSNARPDKYQAGQPALLDDATILDVAARHGAPPATIALAWAVRSGLAIIPKSTHPERIVQNGAALALAQGLSNDDIARLDGLDRRFHFLEAGWRGYAWKRGMSLDELYDNPQTDLRHEHRAPIWTGMTPAVAVVLTTILCCCYCFLSHPTLRGCRR